MPLHSSLGNKSKTLSQKKKNYTMKGNRTARQNGNKKGKEKKKRERGNIHWLPIKNQMLYVL